MYPLGSALVLLSGGQDSATALLWTLALKQSVVALTFDYGQRHRIEVEYAKKIAWTLNVEHIVLNMNWMGQILGSSLGDHNMPISTTGGYQDLPNTFVPGRNMILLSIACSIARVRGIDTVVGGMCETDYSGYPDCRREFVNSFEAAFGYAINGHVHVLTPLMYLNKAQTFAMADDYHALDLIVQNTMTCYEGNETLHEWGRGCGACPACQLRSKGFEKWQEQQGAAVIR
jgi:7-cyano-7-deazaguanine synthase